jgi:hypothetical protein
MKSGLLSVFVCSAALAQSPPTSQSLAGLWDPRSVVENLNTVVKGKPFSATAVLNSTQMLEDGSHINRTTTTVMYRDADGRTRNETDDIVRILDPAGHRIDLDPHNKIAYKSTHYGSIRVALTQTSAVSATGAQSPSDSPKQRATTKRNNEQTQATEDLGMQIVNGVPAHGVRATLTIAVGAIGNDRPLKVVTETWTSDALGVLLKSMNSDPRFGTTTYELTNVVQGPPNPALFEIPGDYAVR